MSTDLNLIADAVKKGEVLLFLGAGVHASPDPKQNLPWVYPDKDRPLFAGELAAELASQSGWSVRFDPARFPPKSNFTRVTLDYELNIEHDNKQTTKYPPEPPLARYSVKDAAEAVNSRKQGRSTLANAVRKAVNVGKVPSPALRGLAQLNFPIIVTTNYDDLFTSALIGAGKNPTTAYYEPRKSGQLDDPIDDPTPKKPFLFKIHGCASTPSSMVLTDEDYIDFVLSMSERESNPVPNTIYHRLRTWPTLFIGYSLMDYNLRLLIRTLRYKKDRFKPSFAIDPYPDALITRVWDDELKYVSFVAEDLWTFVPALYKQVTGNDMPP